MVRSGGSRKRIIMPEGNWPATVPLHRPLVVVVHDRPEMPEPSSFCRPTVADPVAGAVAAYAKRISLVPSYKIASQLVRWVPVVDELAKFDHSNTMYRLGGLPKTWSRINPPAPVKPP